MAAMPDPGIPPATTTSAWGESTILSRCRRGLFLWILVFLAWWGNYLSSYSRTSVPQESVVKSRPSPAKTDPNATAGDHSQKCAPEGARPRARPRTKGLDAIQVAPAYDDSYRNTTAPRILCFTATHSGNHATRIRTILDTWGPKCDKFLIVSNVTDSEVGAVRLSREGTPFATTTTVSNHLLIDQSYSYSHLWIRIQETLLYIANPNNSSLVDEYDFFFKVDDDTFCVMENLRAFLRNQTRLSQGQQRGASDDGSADQPRIWGRRFIWDDKASHNSSEDNQALPPRRRSHVPGGREQPLLDGRGQKVSDFDRMVQTMQQHTGRNDTAPLRQLIYPAGGAGYIMNRAFVKRFAAAVRGLPDGYSPYLVAEDMALGATMQLLMGDGSSSTVQVEKEGDLYFHPELPQNMFNLPNSVAYLRDYHYPRGSLQKGPLCCATFSITFHHVSPKHMRYFYMQLYSTRHQSDDENCTS